MATTQASVCNVALGMIGEQAISGIHDDTPRANALNTHWEPALRELLASAPWKFATKQATLAQVFPAPSFAYSFAYQLPADYISMVTLNGVHIWNQISDFFDIQNGQILTNSETAKVSYVFYQEDYSRWEPLFAKAMARLLASLVASTIRADGAQLAQALEGKYFTVDLPRARMKNAQQQRKTPYNLPANSQWNASRRSSTRG